MKWHMSSGSCTRLYMQTSRILEKIPRCAEVRVKCAAGHHCEDTPTGITCAADPACPANEVFNICASDCEETCVQMGRPCTLNCLPPRCQCKGGFVREGGKCILPEQCPNRQMLKPVTQSYVDEPVTPSSLTCQTATIQILCVEGYHCEIVGGTPQCIPNKKKIPRCAEVRVKCAAGHHCEDTPTGITCAPDPVCPANEVFNICASDCEQTCVPMGRPCTLNCLPPRCQCKGGFVRERGKCILPKQCPNRLQLKSTAQSYVDEPVTPSSLTCQTATIQILCIEGYHCEIVGGTPQCIPNKRNSQPPVTCATTLMLCRDGTHCEDINGRPQCVENELKITPPTCASSQGLCPPHTHCEYRDGRLQCIKDKGVIINSPFPCANVDCPEGQHCEFYHGVAECVKNPGPCAAAFCAGGECIEYDNTFGCFNTTCGPNEEFNRCASCEPTCGPIVVCLNYIILHCKCMWHSKLKFSSPAFPFVNRQSANVLVDMSGTKGNVLNGAAAGGMENMRAHPTVDNLPALSSIVINKHLQAALLMSSAYSMNWGEMPDNPMFS
ncbi:hypothetical protein ANCCAN_10407 [Ancylostoma caninum]|uniref:Follistatin-like domain-containing protein n=1 Tax=Ancylostoma caninum TaxID=29170 RepID=A0A368GGX4_ANCCA|nr:hypothetical protein ANCCAN_10407 [Ancylostoma caninum]